MTSLHGGGCVEGLRTSLGCEGNAKGPSVGSGLLRNVIGLGDGEKAQAGVGYGEVAEAEG